MSIKSEVNKYYIQKFEENFPEWVEDLSRIVTTGGDVSSLRAPVQALVNAYHEEHGKISPVDIPRFNTLMLFIMISGASDQHSGRNESLEILDQARAGK